jgi:hypothetical protein
MTNAEKNKRLVQRLYEKTRAGTLEWQETPDNGFQVSLANNSIKIRTVTKRGSNETLLYVYLINAAGEVADSFHDEELDADEPDTRWFRKLREILQLAQRQARGADKVLNDILSELDNDEG